jgi:hypothetical protein
MVDVESVAWDWTGNLLGDLLQKSRFLAGQPARLS